MNANRKSDESVVPATPANNGAAEAPAESVEERDSAKRNAEQAVSRRTPGRTKRESRGLYGVREAARKDSTLKFTALLHHVNEERLMDAFFDLKKTAAVGVDKVTWRQYEQNVEANIVDLHDRIHRGVYRAKPSLRAWMLKPDGRKRPLVAKCCTGLDELSCRPEQHQPHQAFRRRGDSSLVMDDSPPQPTWSLSLDMDADATPCEATSTARAYHPSSS